MSAPPATEASTRLKPVLAALGVFTLVLGVPAGLYALSGRPDVALWLLAAFVAMLLVTAYALREAVRGSRRGPE